MASCRVIALFLVFIQVCAVKVVGETADKYHTYDTDKKDHEVSNLSKDYPFTYESGKKCSRSFCEAYWSTSGSICISDANWGVNYKLDDKYECSLDIDFSGVLIRCSEPCEPETAEMSTTAKIGFIFVACWLFAFICVLGYVFYSQNNETSGERCDKNEVKVEKTILKYCDTSHTEATAKEFEENGQLIPTASKQQESEQNRENLNQTHDVESKNDEHFHDEETGYLSEEDINKPLPGDSIFQMN